MTNTAYIEVPADITILAGFEYGREIWDEQCAFALCDLSTDYYISLPEWIEGIAVSFIDGLFEHIVALIGAEKAAERLHMNNERLEARVKSYLMLYKDEATL